MVETVLAVLIMKDAGVGDCACHSDRKECQLCA